MASPGWAKARKALAVKADDKPSMDEDLLRWLRVMGFEAVPTRAAAAKLTKGSNRAVWEFLVERAKPAAEAQAIRDDAQAAREGGFNDAEGVQQAKRRAVLRVQRQKQQEANRALQEMLDRQTVSV